MAALKLPASTAYLISTIPGHLAVIGYLAAAGGLTIPWQPAGLAAALGAGLCMAVGLLCFFKALAGGEGRGGGAPHLALSHAFTVILSWALLHEDFTLRHLAGVALALAAVWLLSK